MSVDQSVRPVVDAEAAGISPEHFKSVFRHHPGGVAVITLRTAQGPVGFTATSVISVSADPPVLAFSLAATSSSRAAVESAESVVVNFLGPDQEGVATQFARSGIDRFKDISWCPLPTGEPVLRGTAAWIRAEVDNRIPVGDSLLVTLRAQLAHQREDPAPLVYVDRGYHHLGDHSRTGT